MTIDPSDSDPGLDEFDRETLRIVRTYGHQVISVAASEDDTDPTLPFTYTVGLHQHDPSLPELFIVGQLDPLTMHGIIEDVALTMTHPPDPDRPLQPGDVIPRILGDDYLVKVVPVDPQAAEMFQAIRFASNPDPAGSQALRAWQILWPDRLGRFPDDPEYSHGPMPQPLYPPPTS